SSPTRSNTPSPRFDRSAAPSRTSARRPSQTMAAQTGRARPRRGGDMPVRQLLVLGGAETKARESPRTILECGAERARQRLISMTVATQLPHEAWEEYRDVFTELGVKDI